MAQTIKLKRSASQGAVPTTTQLELGEVAINTYDGKMYIKKDDGSEAIVEVGSTASLIPSGSDGQIQFNSSGALSATTFVYVDDTNSRLGIGNTAPLSDLHVTGTTTLQSSIDFLSPNESNTITLSMLDSDSLSVSGDSGQLFSITDSLTGTIFAVNDISGVPSIEVDDDGTIRFAETFGNVLIGTATDNGTDKLQVNGIVSATGGNSTQWNTAYGWGDHSTAGYLTSYTETDPVFSASAASGITTTNISNWNTAYNNSITSAAVTGTDTKTLTLTQQDGGTVTASWTDDVTQSLNVEYIQFDTTQTGSTAIGQIAWNTDSETLELGLSADVNLELGEQNYFSVKAAEAISAGDVVYASGAVGNSSKIEVSKYIANNTIEEQRVLGLAAEDIAVGEFGYVITLGTLRGVSTDGSALTVPETWLDGTILYPSATVAGELTSVPPEAPNQTIPLAFVTSVSAGNGSLAVRAYDLGYHLEELHDVYVNGVANNDIVAWNSTNSRWENTDIPTIVDDRYVNVTGDTMTGDLTIQGDFSAVNTTLTGYLRGPSSFVIDPAAHGDDTGTVVIAGNLQVDGTTTTINSTTVTVDDKNLVLASGSTNAAAADGAGITIDCGTDTDATLLYDGVDDQFELNKTLHVTGDAGNTATFEGDTQSTINLLAGTTSNYIVGTTSGAISLRPNTATAMTLLSNGNVGIGTLSPSNKLEVATASTTSTALGFTVRNTDSTNDPKFQLGVGYPGYYDDAAIIQHNGTLTAYINSFGEINFMTKVLIASDKTIQSQANGNSLINLFDASNNTVISAGNNLVLKTGAAAERMRIDSNGKIGIGTETPSRKLHVKETSSQTVAVFDGGANNAGEIAFRNDSTSGDTYVTIGAIANDMSLSAGASERMRITSAGLVGIGTTTPAAKLHVDGDFAFASDGTGANWLKWERLASNSWRLTSDGVGHVMQLAGNVLTIPQDVKIGRGGLDIERTYLTSSPALGVTETWNDAATTFTGIKVDVTDTASAANSLLLDLHVDSASKFSIDSTGGASFVSGDVTITTANSGQINASRVIGSFILLNNHSALHTSYGLNLASNKQVGWNDQTNSWHSAPDTILVRDAAGVLAQRNGTNPQAFNVYNTYTDASNYERGVFKWNSNVLEIGTEHLGTGTERGVKILSGGSERIGIDTFVNSSISFAPSGVTRAVINSVGTLISRSIIALASDQIGFSSSITTSAYNTADTGIARDSAGVIKVTDGSTGLGDIVVDNINTNSLTLSPTWNDANTTFTAIDLNVTDTASASDSLLMNLQVDGTSKFSVEKTGNIATDGTRLQLGKNGGTTSWVYSGNSGAGNTIYLGGSGDLNTAVAALSYPQLYLRTAAYFGWASGTAINTSPDLRLYRDAANTLAQRNSTNSQTFNLYNTYTDASNYERTSFTQTTTGLVLDSQYLGTGTERNNILELKSNGVVQAFIENSGLGYFGSTNSNRVRIGFNSSPAGGADRMGLFATGSGRLWLGAYANMYFGYNGNIGITGSSFGFASSTQGSLDTLLVRDNVGVLAQRNGTNAQTFNIYNTYTDASNYERASLKWDTNTFTFSSEALGTGTVRNFNFQGGNVGVGITTPNSELEIYGASAPKLLITDSNIFKLGIEVDNGIARFKSYNGSYGLHRTPLSFNLNVGDLISDGGLILAGSTIQLGNNSHRIISTPDDFAIVDTQSSFKGFRFLGNVPSDTLVLQSTGNVGIGTSTPEQKLDIVQGNVAIDREYSYGVQHLTTYYPIIGLNSSNQRVFGDLTSNTGTRITLFSSEIQLGTNNSSIVFKNGSLNTEIARLNGDGSWQDADHTFELRNSTNAQAFNLYKTYTDASNYERLTTTSGTNEFIIKSEAAGTGAGKNLLIQGGSNLAAQGNIQLSTALVSIGYRLLALGHSSKTTLYSPSEGILRLSNDTQNDFNRLNFGGDTSSYPTIKKNSTSLEIKLADDSAFTNIKAKSFESENSSQTSETATLATVTQTEIASFAAATYSSGKFVIQAKDTVSGEVHISEILVVHDGTTASATEYATIHTGTSVLAAYEVDINGGNVRILATSASTNSTTYKVSETLITS